MDLDTIQFFLSQEIIEDFTTIYFNNGSNKKAEELAKEQIATKLGVNKKDLTISKKKLSAETLTNFNTSDLKRDVATDLGSEQSINQIKTFLAYKKMSRPISNLVTATKIGELGLGPSDSDNLNRLDQLSFENFEGILGANELLNRTDLFSYHLNKVIADGRKLIVGDRTKRQIRLPDRDTGAFFYLRQMFNNYKADSILTVKEIELINKKTS